jgi:energy-converting hydrogenase B subunit D
MIVLQAAVMGVVALLALAAVLTREPIAQLIVFTLFGAALAGLFVVLQAPDVALSEITVGGAAYPLMVLLALAKMRERRR